VVGGIFSCWASPSGALGSGAPLDRPMAGSFVSIQVFRDVADVIISTLVVSPRKPPVAPLGGASLFVHRNLVRPRYAAPNDDSTLR